MSGVEWGAEIPVDGVRPVWLADDMWDKVAADCEYVGWQYPSHNTIKNVADWEWGRLHSIKLPTSHFAYTAIAKGFEPWGGGDEAPADWDGGSAMQRDGGLVHPSSLNRPWNDDCLMGDIIGYRKRKQLEVANAKAEPSHVSVKRMTEDEVIDGRFRQYSDYGPLAAIAEALRDLGVIRPETNAERIAIKTGLTVAQVEAVLAADKEEK